MWWQRRVLMTKGEFMRTWIVENKKKLKKKRKNDRREMVESRTMECGRRCWRRQRRRWVWVFASHVVAVVGQTSLCMRVSASIANVNWECVFRGYAGCLYLPVFDVVRTSLFPLCHFFPFSLVLFLFRYSKRPQTDDFNDRFLRAVVAVPHIEIRMCIRRVAH